jgi:hypothetical protein
MKITDVIISAIIKKGVLYEARNCEMEFDIPSTETGDNGETRETTIKIRFKAEHMKLSMDKD